MSAAIPPQLFEIAVRAQGDAVCITDPELDRPGPQILFVNEAFTRLTGYAASEIVGETPRILQGPLTDGTVMARMRRQLEAGERFEGEAINYRKDGTPFVMHWTIDPVLDAGGTRTHFVAVQRDVTAMRQLERLRTADRRLATAMISLADGTDLDRATATATQVIRRSLAAMLFVGDPIIATRLGGRWVTEPGVDGDTRTRLVGLVRGHDRAAEVPDGSTLQLVAPFRTSDTPGGIVVGGITPSTAALVHPEYLAEFATTAGRALHALASIAERRRETLAVQRVLLPAPEYDIEGFTIHAHYRPSRRTEQAGGDWYDAIGLDGHARLVIGDVVGKGLRAAAEMGLIRSHVQALLASGAALESVIADADEFCRTESIMATAAIVDVDGATGRIRAVSAGHPPPLVAAGEDTRFVEVASVPPLGAFREAGPAAHAATDRLDGGCLVMYTDGVLDERRTGIGEGLNWLRTTLAVAEPPTAEAAGRVLFEATGDDRDDDTAVLAISRISP